MKPRAGLTMSSPTTRKNDSGFTLLEVMLAVVILSVGLLGLAGMQGIALGRNVNANELTVASNLAADMIERIQFNKWNAAAYDLIDTSSAPPPTVVAQVMAMGDYTQWQARLASTRLKGVKGLVTATPIVTSPTLNQTTVLVTVQWTGGQGDSTAVIQHRVAVGMIIAPQ